MGLFSTKRKTYVTTSYSRVIEDKDILNLNKTAVYDYIFQGSKGIRVQHESPSVTFYIQQQAENSITHKMNRARNWANANYEYGLPVGSMYDRDSINLHEIMDEYLERTLSQPVQIIYAEFGALMYAHAAWQMAFDSLGYSSQDNKLGLAKRSELVDFVINYSNSNLDNLIDPESLYQKGYPANYGVTPKRTQDLKRKWTTYTTSNAEIDTVTYTLYDGTSIVKDFKKYVPDLVPIEGEMGEEGGEVNYTVPPDLDYIMVQYLDKDGNLGVFTYAYNSGEISELDNLFKGVGDDSDYYPNLYFRLEKQNLTKNAYANSKAHKDSRQLAKRMGIKYDELSDTIHKEVEGINDVVQCFIGFQLQLNSEDNRIHKYFYEYFMNIYTNLPRQFADTNYNSAERDYINGMAKAGKTIEIKDKAYTMRLSLGSIRYKDIRGKIGKVGTVTHSFGNERVESTGSFTSSSVMPTHTYRKQVTENVYRELKIANISMTQVVQGGHVTTVGGNDENLHIPMERSILRKLNFKDRSWIVSASMVIVFNVTKVVKKKWYQSGIFQAIMMVVAIVISIYTSGAGSGVVAALMAAGKAILIGVVVSIAINIAVKVLDIDMGIVFAVIAVAMIVAGAAANMNGGSVMGFTSTQFMQAANISFNISNASQKLELEKTIQNYHSEREDLVAKFAELEKRQEELERDPYMTLSYLLSDNFRTNNIVIGESVNDLVLRSTAVNMGMAPIDLIASMVEATVGRPTEQEILNKIYSRSLNGEQYV